MMTWSEGNPHGVTVTVTDQPTLLDDLAARLRAGQGFSVATLNLDHVVKLSRNPRFRAAYAAHTHVTADGKPIVWLSRLAGQQVSLVPGSELIEPLVAKAVEARVPVAFFGSSQETLEVAADRLRARHRGLEIALCRAPVMGFDPESAVVEEDIAALKASGARLVFLALGAPKQEVFAARAQMALPEMGFVSVGAGLDFIAGTQRRAPAWVQAIAAEWLWRMLSDPRRLAARYGACIAVLPKLLARALRSRQQRRAWP